MACGGNPNPVFVGPGKVPSSPSTWKASETDETAPLFLYVVL